MSLSRARLSLFVLAGALVGCRAGAPARADDPIPVRLTTLTAAPSGEGLRFSGTIEPVTRVEMAFKVGGYVATLATADGPDGHAHKLQEGDHVAAGAVLASLRQADYATQLAAAGAALSGAKAAAAQAELDLSRSVRLADAGVTAPAELDARSTSHDAAAARARQAEAALDAARIALSDTQLHAPFAGVVLRRAVEVGSLVAPGTPAFSLGDVSRVKVLFGVPDTVVQRLHLGDRVGVEVQALGRAVSGDVTRIAAAADPRSRVFEIEVTVANPDEALRVGMIGTVRLGARGEGGPRVALPLTAVVRSPKDPKGYAAYVVEGEGDVGAARLREVTLGDVVGREVIALSGVAPGERVVSTGATLVRDGERVLRVP
jgi:multidrug efflux system membrane fusion protein